MEGLERLELISFNYCVKQAKKKKYRIVQYLSNLPLQFKLEYSKEQKRVN